MSAHSSDELLASSVSHLLASSSFQSDLLPTLHQPEMESASLAARDQVHAAAERYIQLVLTRAYHIMCNRLGHTSPSVPGADASDASSATVGPSSIAIDEVALELAIAEHPMDEDERQREEVHFTRQTLATTINGAPIPGISHQLAEQPRTFPRLPPDHEA